MAIARISGVRVSGVASAIPEGVATADQLSAHFTPQEVDKIVATVGVKTRHIASDGLCTSDLCYEAAVPLLAHLGWQAESLDLLIFVSQTPDYILPSTASVLHGRLKCAKSCALIDINQGCSGYVYGMWAMLSMMSASGFRRGLLLVGDTISKVISPQDRAAAPLFGDAGTATAFELDPAAKASFFCLGSDGDRCQHLIIPAGGFRTRQTAETALRKEREGGNKRSDQDLFMNGTEVFAFTLREVPPMIQAVLDESHLSVEEVGCFLLHQANAFIIKHLVKKMKLPPEKVPITLEEYGNTSSASIPLALCSLAARSPELIGPHMVLAGFGVGLSWAAGLTDLSRALILPVVTAKG